MPMNESAFRSEASVFLERILSDVAAAKLKLSSHWEIDHLCFRVETLERYEVWKAQLARFANLLIESEVNGRPIATYELEQPIEFHDRTVSVIELPAPKRGKVVKEGFEHIEVTCDEPFDEIASRHPDLVFDRSGLSKSFNSELEVTLPSGAVKYHHLTLASVVRFEGNTRVHQAVVASKILETLSAFHPEVAGTIPLGIDVEGSDVDILMGASDFEAVKQKFRESGSHLGECHFKEKELGGRSSLIVRFTFDGVPFEVVAQGEAPVRQTAYRHFLVEERLLRIGGTDFVSEIRRFRGTGEKTEPAFARALGLKGDPYIELLKLDGLSEKQLRAFFHRSS